MMVAVEAAGQIGAVAGVRQHEAQAEAENRDMDGRHKQKRLIC